MRVGLYLYNPATKQSIHLCSLTEGEETVDFLLKDGIGKAIHSASEILGKPPMEVMANPDLNRFTLRMKIEAENCSNCNKPWGECTCGRPAPRPMA